MRCVILTPGGRNKNELPSGTDPAHWAEQQNIEWPLTRRSKTDAWTLSLRSYGNLMIALVRSREDWLLPRASRDLVISARSGDCRAKL